MNKKSKKKASMKRDALIAGSTFILLSLIALIVYYVFIRDSDKVLKCKISTTEMDVSINQEWIMNFKDDKFIDGTIVQTHDATTYGTDKAELFNQLNLCDGFEKYSNSGMQVVDCKQTIVKNRAITYSNVKVTEAYKDNKNNIKKLKDYMNSIGYTCTEE